MNKNKKFSTNLTKDEKELLVSVEKGEWRPIDDFEIYKKMLMKMAKNSHSKAKNVNIRMSEADWYKIKVKAAENGLPYQTLMATVLHQYANGKIGAGL